MKRSRIFLGTTTCVLAVAAVATAASIKSPQRAFYCTQGIGVGKCVATPLGFQVPCIPIPSGPYTCVHFIPNYGLKTLYTTGHIAMPGNCGIATNCDVKFKYEILE